jgi:hypothetical protein
MTAVLEGSNFTAVNLTFAKKSVHIGILILEPTEDETIEIDGSKYYLIDDLIGLKTTTIALEQDLQRDED